VYELKKMGIGLKEPCWVGLGSDPGWVGLVPGAGLDHGFRDGKEVV
jgi:hypothetical protein